MQDIASGDIVKPKAFLRWDVHAHDALATVGVIDLMRR